ncbi:MAG: bifunctional acetate--CoA ligase family protein/GNAT family N-acetyltransferase [Pirellulales bacterium]
MSTTFQPYLAGNATHVSHLSSPGLPAPPGGRRPQGLDALFLPRTVAVIGASERPGSVGRTVFNNLLAGSSTRRVLPINPQRPQVLGHTAYPRVGAVPEPIDLAVLVTPAPTIPGLIEECAECGIPAAIIISAGFKELGAAGEQLEQRVLATARAASLRVIGPNCLGLMNPLLGLNATFAGAQALPGKLAFLSQSGALCTAILDWSLAEQVGFSAFVSVGSMLDVGWGDLIDYFGRDPRTQSILLYMESVGDARSFLSAAREVALSKPIIVIKGGRSESASKAAASHTGALAGSDLVFDAALRRVGVLRVERIAELFSTAAVLDKQPRPRGRRLTIVTNAGGPGVLATDALAQGGGELAELAPATRAALDQLLPPHWSRGNPIDVLGDADAERYGQTLEVAARDPNTDGYLVILTPQDMTDPLGTAARLQPLARLRDKPVLASWMGGPAVEAAAARLAAASIPNFPYPDTAVRAFNYLWQYSDTLRDIYETPSLLADGLDNVEVRRMAARAVIDEAFRDQRRLLTEEQAKRLFQAYGIPVTPTRVAQRIEDAVAVAREFGFPVVLKLYSHTITHKTDVGGVRLDLTTPEAVAEAFLGIERGVRATVGAEHFQGVTVQPMVRTDGGYETILGSTLDPQFGPVLMFGAGGQLVEVFRDRAFGLPPLNATLALRMLEQTRIFRAFAGVRGRPPIDLEALQRTLINFGHLLVEQPWIAECDINPLVVSPKGVMALDARVLLHPAGTDLATLPRPAIRPYPLEFVERHTLSDGLAVTLRPIRLEDEPMMVRFHATLSDLSVRRRYFQAMGLSRRTEHDRLIRVCFNDYDRELATVAEIRDPVTGGLQIVAVGRLSRASRPGVVEFAVTVGDPWHQRGIGTRVLQHLIHIAQREGLQRIVGRVLADNYAMQALCRKVGFQLEYLPLDEEYRAELRLVG